MQTLKTSRSKENILARVRKALGEQALPIPFPEAEKESDASIFPKSGMSSEEAFAENFVALGGKFVFCDNEQELLENIYSLYENRGWQKLFCADKRLFQIFHNNKLNIVQPADNAQPDADACITGCEMLIGRTGSAIFSSRQNLGRTAPVYYPVHIIVAYAGQATADVSDALILLKKKYKDGLPSMLNINTGPSRTADIEKTLVVGVHGPAEVFCFYVNA